MDYLYINGVVNETYKDMPCGCPFPEAYRNMLHATVAAQDWQNPEIPRVISCFTLRTNGEEPVIVLSSVQRHGSTASVARMIQCDGWQWNPELLRGQLDQVLHAGFYTEAEVIEPGKRFALPKDRTISYDDVPIRMPAKVREAVLTAVFLRWMRYDPVLRVAVPKGVDYNSYVISAVKAMYALFPLGLRAKAGFCSYLPKDEQAAETVSIGFVPEEMADSRTLFLDGSSAAVCQSLCCGTNNKGLNTLIQYLSQSPDAERAAFLDEVFRELKGSGEGDQLLKIKPNDYAVVGTGLNLLTLDGSLREMMPQWKKDFLDAPERHTATMQSRIRDKIRNAIDPAEFCAMAEESWKRGESDVFTSLKDYAPFCQENQPLKDALWETMLKHMTARMSFGEVYQMVTRRERDVSCLLDGEKKDWLFCKAKNEAFQALQKEPVKELEQFEARKAQAQALRAEVAKAPASRNTRELLTQVDSYIQALDKQYNALRCRQLSDRFQKIKSMPDKTVQQREEQLQQAKEVQQLLQKLPQSPERDTLCKNLKQFIDKIEAFIRSSGAKFARIQEILSGKKGYFAALEELDRVDRNQQEEAEWQNITRQLDKKRPGDAELYAKEFEAFYRKPLILANIAKLGDYACSRVVRDICQLNRIQLRCSADKQADATVRQIDGAMYLAEKISAEHKVFVAMGNDPNLDTSWLRQMLRLRLDARSMGDPENFKKIFRSLAQGGAFTGDDMIPALEMFRRCGQKYIQLFRLMLQGCFRDATEAQYLLAYKLILEYTDGDKTRVLEKMEEALAAEIKTDKAASRAFQEFLKSRAPARKGSKAWMITSIALGVLTVALIGAVVLLVLKHAPQNAEPEQTLPVETTMATTAPTEPEVTIPELPDAYAYAMRHEETLDMLYGLSFDEHQAIVEAVLVEYGDDLMESFEANKGTTLTIGVGVDVSWEEYLFWACRNSYDDTTALSDTSALTRALLETDESVLEILRVIHQEQISGLNTDPDTTGQEENAPAENADVKTAISAAARDAFESSVETNEEYHLLLRLLGTNFNMDFASLSIDFAAVLPWAEKEAVEKHYAALPGTLMVSPEGTDAIVTWNEYVFWECWCLKNYRKVTITADSFDEDLSQDVARVLNMIHCLGGEDVHRRTAEYPVVEGMDLYQTIAAYAQASFETACQDCRTAYALEETLPEPEM